MTVRVARQLPASRARVWAELREIERHVEWMADAVAITFTSSQREGVGTTFRCLTRVGPLSLVDVMTITSWREQEALGVRHEGLVTGEGDFALRDDDAGTLVSWTETLHFPWWLGGHVGELIARPVFGSLWRGNLRRLAERVDDST